MIKAAAHGDGRAFETLMCAHLKVLYNYIASKVGPRERVQDVFQDTMLSIWKGIGAYGQRSSFRTWMISIARRRIADHYRDAARRGRTVSMDDHEGTLAAPGSIDGAAERIAVRQALARLSPADREMAYLAFNAQLSYSEVSEALDMPLGTVKRRMAAIKAALREQLT